MHQAFVELIAPLGSEGRLIEVLHPVPFTLVVAVLLILIVRRTRLRAWWRRILLVLLALYAVDAAFALRRVAYAWASPTAPLIARTIALPARPVLVNIECDRACHDKLIDGVFAEVYLVRDLDRSAGKMEYTRIRPAWTDPARCPIETGRRTGLGGGARYLNYCPLYEASEPPQDGVFLVAEWHWIGAGDLARPFQPVHLVTRPPGPMIKFYGLEIQLRTNGNIEVLASARGYEAPGVLGLPPLIGCWPRRAGLLPTLPPGDVGCGLWRWITRGGNEFAVTLRDWVFERAFTAPEHPRIEPPR